MPQARDVRPEDAVTVLVFKDNHASRMFELPLGWVNRFGILIGIAILLTLASIAFAVRTHFEAKRSTPTRLKELEQQIVELRSQIAQVPTSEVHAPQPQAPSAPLAQPTAPSPSAPTPAVTPPGILPLLATPPAPVPESLSFKISEPRVTWKGRSLQVRFGIQYTRGDGGSQQGKIIIIAKGPQTFLSYPDGTLNGTPQSILDANKGEFFSVRAFRATAADFGPLTAAQAIYQVQAIITDTEGRLLLITDIPFLPAKAGGTPDGGVMGPPPAPKANP